MTKKDTKVAPIPRGFKAITPHITAIDVNAAVALYESALGATRVSVETVPGTDIVIFAQLKIGNSALTIGQGEAFGAGFVSLHHYVDDADTTWANALGAGFTELKTLEETYWGDRMGLMIDPLGVRWSIAQRVMRLTADERNARAKAAMDIPVQTADEQAQVMPINDEAPTDIAPLALPVASDAKADTGPQAAHYCRTKNTAAGPLGPVAVHKQLTTMPASTMRGVYPERGFK